MRQDCCGILPTFLSFGTHQGETTPHVTANQKPLWVFSSLLPQRNVSFPQQITINTIHHLSYHQRPVEEHLLKKQKPQLGLLKIQHRSLKRIVELALLKMHQRNLMRTAELVCVKSHFVQMVVQNIMLIFFRKEFGCLKNIHVHKEEFDKYVLVILLI